VARLCCPVPSGVLCMLGDFDAMTHFLSALGGWAGWQNGRQGSGGGGRIPHAT
jgi:hypothetical protein